MTLCNMSSATGQEPTRSLKDWRERDKGRAGEVLAVESGCCKPEPHTDCEPQLPCPYLGSQYPPLKVILRGDGTMSAAVDPLDVW